MDTRQHTKEIFRADNHILYRLCFFKEILLTLFLLISFNRLLAIPECVDIKKDVC
jgi:hypothetical protein